MYLRECLIENVGPISLLDISLDLNSEGNPKPLIMVGKNGTGKTIFLAYILDALAELAKKKFRDISIGQRQDFSPYIKITGGGDIRSLSGNSITLVEFIEGDSKFCYLERIGTIDPIDYTEKRRGRFESVKSWPMDDSSYKVTTGDEKQIETLFETGSVCFFPCSRNERPHWLNSSAVEDQPLFRNNQKFSGVLKKPLIIERSAEDNQQWLMDVFLDSLMDGDWINGITPEGTAQIQWQINSNIQHKHLLKLSRQNIEQILCSILEDENAKLILNYRNALHGRVAIRLGNGIVIPSFVHLSAGQAILFNLFSTIIRYADRWDIEKSINLSEIKGIVLIDEIEAHLHTDLQYEVLPKLVKLFPKVQFIITSHSPLFLLGMEREFGTDGIQILEMPTGNKISTERFEEFLKSFDFYSKTQFFENTVQRKVLESSKPLVLTEGQTDVDYIKMALGLLGHENLLEKIEIDEIGKAAKDGVKGGGQTNLDSARKFLENNINRFPRKVLFLYDCDTKERIEKVVDIGSLSSRYIPQNNLNIKVTKGIENLFPSELFEEKFYQEKTTTKGYGDESIIREFRKPDFCKWICEERKEKNDFLQFEKLLIPILQKFISPD
jgi:AAA domain, putative AbiEii toxin, Type IV TA system